MSYSVTVRREAELDIQNAFYYYEGQRQGLGHDLLLCIEEALSKIARHPLSYKTVHNEIRHIAIHRFPYRIFYLVIDKDVIVTAVFHAR